MRASRLSPQTDDAIRRLWALDRPVPRPGTFRSLLGAHASGLSGAAEAHALAEAIATAGETDAIYPLAKLALQPKLRGSEAAGRAIEALLMRTPPGALARVDERCRSALNVYGSPVPNLSPADVVRFAESGVAAFARAVLASFHPSGYVREEAVKQLPERFAGRAVPYLLLRTNDWVEPVRRRAVEACRGMLHVEHAGAFVNHLVLVLRLERCGRGGAAAARAGQTALAGAVRAFLLSDGLLALRLGSAQGGESVRRACFRLRFEAGGTLEAEALGEAIAAEAPFLRVQAARRARNIGGSLLSGLLPRMRADRCASVRLEALRADGEASSAEGRRLLECALCDRNAAIRAAARFYLGRNDPFDAAAFYRARLAGAEPPAPPAVEGLGETGNEADVPALLKLCAHPNARVRASALGAAARLGPDAAYQALGAALADPSPSVSRRAAEALVRAGRAETSRRIAALLDVHQAPHVERNALRVLKEAPKWQQLWLCLRALRSPAEGVRRESVRLLSRWLAYYCRSALAPGRGELDRAREELAASARLLDARTVEEIRFVLEGWRV